MRNLGGRPKGSTIIQQKEDKQKYFSMVNYLSEEYAKVRLTNQKIHKSQFEVMLEEAKSK